MGAWEGDVHEAYKGSCGKTAVSLGGGSYLLCLFVLLPAVSGKAAYASSV